MPLSLAAKSQWQIHFCVLLWGFTSILGKLITLPALPLVWWRMLIVVAALACVPRVWRQLRTLPPRVIGAYVGVGVLVSLHWLTFYSAVKLANASVAATCIAIAPVFLSLMEPWIARRKFSAAELLLGIGVVPGVALVVGGIPTNMRLGLAIGVLSAVFVALFSAFNKKLAERTDALTATGIELAAGTAFLSLLAPLLPHSGPAFVLPDWHDTWLLLVLALGCTLLPFALALATLRHVSAYTMQIVTNLEPVYAIILAIIILGEQRQLDGMFYLGVAVILATVIVHPLLGRRRRQAAQRELLAAVETAASEAHR